jgi:hypothetical protein
VQFHDETVEVTRHYEGAISLPIEQVEQDSRSLVEDEPYLDTTLPAEKNDDVIGDIGFNVWIPPPILFPPKDIAF